MEIIKENDKEMVNHAVNVLRNGEMIIYPTETCYGIGVDATNEKSIQKVYVAKRRPIEKPISIAFSDIKMVKKFIDLNENALKLIKTFMPGPLTLVIKNKNFSKLLGIDNIGFRIPDRKSVRNIIKKFGKPITSTSANISGEPPLYDPNEIKKKFWMVASLLIDGGILDPNPPSTVFDVDRKIILRKGKLSLEQIIRVLNDKN